MVYLGIVTSPLLEVSDGKMFGCFLFVLFLLGIYMFYIFPNKAKRIKEQEQEIERLILVVKKLEEENARLSRNY